MIASVIALAIVLATLLFALAHLGPVVRDVSDVLRASVTGGRLSQGKWSNLAVALLWVLLLAVSGAPV